MARASRTRSEVELGKPVLAWLAEHQWDVFQEVAIDGSVADIVAVFDGRLVAIVELKVAFGLDVIGQAERWRTRAHFAYAAVASAKRSDTRRFAERVCGDLGVGVFSVAHDEARLLVSAKLNRRPDVARVLATLDAEHKTYAPAGTNSGRHWSSFLRTCKAVREAVVRAPGLSIREVLAGVERHHYANDASARSCLLHWAERGRVPGVRVDRQGKRVLFYPAEAP